MAQSGQTMISHHLILRVAYLHWPLFVEYKVTGLTPYPLGGLYRLPPMTEQHTRVTIWNSFFKLAWTEAKRVFEIENNCQSKDMFDPLGGTLPESEFHVLAAVVLCNLAIEARANHLIDELVETGKISADLGDAARWLPTKQKWFLIPTLAGVSNRLDSSSGPHQAIAQLCDLRNDFLHVNYQAMKQRLPAPGTMVSYFRRFVEAMEDMNVMLRRERNGPKPEVLKIGQFNCG